MRTTERIIPTAFLVCVALTACTGERDGYPGDRPVGPETIAQPNTPAPQAAAPVAPAARDSSATKPLDPALKRSSTLLPKAPKVIWV